MIDFLFCCILQSKSIGNCSNGGVSARRNNVCLFPEHLSIEEIKFIAVHNKLELDECVKVISNVKLDYIKAVPITLLESGKWFMFGGCYVKTSDSRFKEITNCKYPIPLHDRID
jgi:hypothetical protein